MSLDGGKDSETNPFPSSLLEQMVKAILILASHCGVSSILILILHTFNVQCRAEELHVVSVKKVTLCKQLSCSLAVEQTPTKVKEKQTCMFS